jgi:hypothetical protein
MGDGTMTEGKRDAEAASLRGLSFEDARQVRDARSRAFFRELNERISELQRSRMFIEFACECCDQACVEPVVLSIDEYEEVRRSPTSFVVVPGHLADGDVVLATSDRYAVVRARGVAGSVATELDPRA